MFKKLKKFFYFPVAAYFWFFAKLYLKKWNPKIIVVTGSQGKTTLLHLLESQLGQVAKYSHNANSAFGIAFHILGMHRETFSLFEWPLLFLLAPFQVLRKVYSEKIYVVEADCDRPGDGSFLAPLLCPDIVLWVSVSRTHSMNFAVSSHETIESVTAQEFAHFAKNAKSLVIANGDTKEIAALLEGLSVRTLLSRQSEYLTNFAVLAKGTEFVIDGTRCCIPYLLPKEAALSLYMTKTVCRELGVPFDPSFQKLVLPPGRSSIFLGKENRILIDSSYNASLESMRAMLELFGVYPHKPKWVVLGDMLELGNYEQDEHTRLADHIRILDPECVILVGPRLRANTLPALTGLANVVSFDGPREALTYIERESQGGEAILFKGARFLEGIIEKLLANQDDVAKLPRREKVWQKRRKQWDI